MIRRAHAARAIYAAMLFHGNRVGIGPAENRQRRFRGVSLSNKDPALQGTLNLNDASGLNAGIWGSSLDDTPF